MWQNAPGEALYYTILFKEPLADPACLSLASGLAAARALEECFGVECALKWPNDLLLGGKRRWASSARALAARSSAASG